MSKHTPGPWRVVRANPSPTSGEWMVSGAVPGYLAEARNCGSGDVQANANLIAAAPEMYEALKRVSESLKAIGDLPSMRADIDAVIAKAEGAKQ